MFLQKRASLDIRRALCYHINESSNNENERRIYFMLVPIIALVAYLTVFVLCYYYALITHSTLWLVLSAVLFAFGAWLLWCRLYGCVRSILSRRRFVRKIKRLTAERNQTVSLSHKPSRAFFKVYHGEDLIITTAEKTYHLKFFPHFTRKKNVHIIDLHRAVFSRPWALVAPRRVYGMASIAFTESLFEHGKKIDLTFDANEDGAERVVIISPSCHQLTCVKANGRDVIDNGYRFQNDVTFYFQDSFLGYLER